MVSLLQEPLVDVPPEGCRLSLIPPPRFLVSIRGNPCPICESVRLGSMRCAERVGLLAADPYGQGVRRGARNGAPVGAGAVGSLVQHRAAEAGRRTVGVQLQASRRLQQDGQPLTRAT